MRITKTMREALRRMLGNCGEIQRRKGGYWTTQASRSFDWWTGVGTLRALERRDLVYVDEFVPDRLPSGTPTTYRLTVAGFEVAEKLKEES